MTNEKPDSKKKVLIISQCFAPNTGGVETHLTDLINYLQQRNIPTQVLTYQPLVTKAKGLPRETQGSVNIRRYSWIGFGLFNKFEPYPAIQFAYLFPVLFMRSFFYMLFNRKNVAVIHVHGMVCAVIGRFLKAIFGTRLVVSTHAVYGWLYDFKGGGILPRFLKWVLTGADKVLSLAEAARREVVALGVPEQNTGVFTYWVDTIFCSPSDKKGARTHLQWNWNDFTVLFVGRLIAVKGVEVLLKVAEEFPDVKFVFAGDGPLKEKLEQTAKERSNVIYAGRVDNKDLPWYYSATDVLCVPSQYEEGFGRIILEALSCGCSVIAANKGGIPEAMDNTVGILLDPTVENIKKAIVALKTDSGRLGRLREASRKYAMAKYSLNNARVIEDSYGLS